MVYDIYLLREFMLFHFYDSCHDSFSSNTEPLKWKKPTLLQK